MRKLTIAAASAVLALALAPSAAFADGGLEVGYEPGKVLVVFDSGATKHEADRALRSVQAVEDTAVSIADLAQPVKMAALDVAEGSTVQEAIEELEQDDAVSYAQPNYLYKLYDSKTQAPAAETGRAQGTQAAGAPSAGAFSLVAPQGIDLLTTNINDKLRSKQWYLASINAYKAWDTCKVEGRVTVAVLDTGITMDHADLKDRIVAPYDVVGDDRTDDSTSKPDYSPDDESGHGTHVAGIIAAQANNRFGTAGVSYNANVMPLRVCYYSHAAGGYIASSVDLASAYTYLLSRAPEDVNGDGAVGTMAEEYNVRVANMSLGALYNDANYTEQELADDKVVLDLVDRANARGILTVCAAGNDNSQQFSWPSDHPTCVSVIALDRDDKRASYSNYGKDKDIAAPGTDIFSTVPMAYESQGVVARDEDGEKHCFANLSGTSMASPVVAGVAAQVFAANPSLTPAGVKDILYATAVDLGDPGFDNQYAYGKVDADAAVKAATAIAATSIEDLPTLARVGEPLALAGRVVPASASNQEIVFELIDAGDTGAQVSGDTFTATAPGTAAMRAVIYHGGANGADLVQKFTISVVAPEKPDDVSDGESGGPSDSGDAGSGVEAGSGSQGGNVAVQKLTVKGLAGTYTYTGKPITPKLSVLLGQKALVQGTDFDLAYSKNVNVGTAHGTITLKGNYSGAATLSFDIVAPASTSAQASQSQSASAPAAAAKSSASTATASMAQSAATSKAKVPAPKVKSLKAATKGFTVKWAKLAKSKATGYQVRYSLKKNMKSSKKKTVKKVSATSLKVGKLKAKKTYYVQVRAYKSAGGKTCYSAWTRAKKVTTRK